MESESKKPGNNFDHIAKFTVPPTPRDTIAPFVWGQIVESMECGAKEVIVLPDNNFGEALTVDYEHLFQDSKTSWPKTRSWDTLRAFISPFKLDSRISEVLRPFRDGVCINSFHWNKGLKIFMGDENLFFRALQGDRIAQDEVSADLGGSTLLKKYWSADVNKYRIFVHRKDNWNHWEMEGPFNSQLSASAAFEERKVEFINNPPARIRHGIYVNTGQINAVLLYDGTKLVSQIAVPGQGVDSNMSSLYRKR
jgi:hypothetical protein